MERRKQTGHICRWMAFGITIATIVVGCTIGIGLLNGATEVVWRIEMQNCIFGEKACMI